MLGVRNYLCASYRIIPLLSRCFVRVDLFFFEVLLGQKLRVAAEQYVCSATSHVRGYSYLPLTTGLSNDVGFARGIFGLGIQNVVRHAQLLEPRRETFRIINRDRTDKHRLPFFVK